MLWVALLLLARYQPCVALEPRPSFVSSSPVAFLGIKKNGETDPQIITSVGKATTWRVKATVPDKTARIRLKIDGVSGLRNTPDAPTCEEGMSNGYSVSNECTVTTTWTPAARDYGATLIYTTQSKVGNPPVYDESISLFVYFFIVQAGDAGCAVMFRKDLSFGSPCQAGNTYLPSCPTHSFTGGGGCPPTSGPLNCTAKGVADEKIPTSHYWDGLKCLFESAASWGTQLETARPGPDGPATNGSVSSNATAPATNGSVSSNATALSPFAPDKSGAPHTALLLLPGHLLLVASAAAFAKVWPC